MKLPDGSTINIHSMEDLPDADKYTGFVYLIRNQLTGKIYIGKKVFRNTRKKKISQRVKKATGTRKTYERQVKESDWLDYFGSSKELLADIQKHGKQYFSREIIELCCSKKYLSYAEVFWQMQFDVLRRNSYNGNILGRYYTRDMENCKS
jgi:hypothetical protein